MVQVGNSTFTCRSTFLYVAQVSPMREEEQVGSGLLGVAFFLGILGWKSQRIKIHRLAYRFSIDF
jgi:hypothetical protein